MSSEVNIVRGEKLLADIPDQTPSEQPLWRSKTSFPRQNPVSLCKSNYRQLLRVTLLDLLDWAFSQSDCHLAKKVNYNEKNISSLRRPILVSNIWVNQKQLHAKSGE